MAQAKINKLVTDSFLQSILHTSASAREASLILLRVATETPEDADAICRAQKSLQARLARLRGQNRKLAQLVRSTKAHTSASRAEIDTLHLSLQNLYYESRHLVGEIASCESFAHPYLQLPMISEDDFLALEDNAEWREKRHGDQDGVGESALMEARIEREYQDRLRLEEERKILVSKRTELVKENARRKDALAKLDVEMEKFVAAADPIQKIFEKDL